MNQVISFISESDDFLQHSQYRPIHNIFIPIYFIDEIWVDLQFPELQPWYMISNYGRVYSKLNHCILKTQVNTRGYESIVLSCMPGITCTNVIHVLVARCFIKNNNPYEYDQVNHIDGNKLNNHFSNLEWVDQSLNMLHAYAIGLRKQGEEHNFAKDFTEEQIHLMCEGLEKRMSYEDICEKLLKLEYTDAIKATICAVKTKRNWKCVSKLYDIPNTNRNDQVLLDEDLHLICKCLEEGLSTRQILDKLLIASENERQVRLIITRIRRRNRFTRISENYNF